MENKKQNNNLKNKLDQHEFDFRPQSWDNMEALLDGKKPRNKSYFKTKTILIMTTVFFFLAYLLMQQPASPTLGDFQTQQGNEPKLTTFEKLSTLNPVDSLSPPPTVHFPPLTDSSFFNRIAQKLTAFNDHYSPEKTYLQFDRTFFEPSEPIWFNAFVRNANSLKTNAKSEILYAELVAPNGSVLNKITLRLKNGQAAGDFILDKAATGGMYKIKAYTNWQLNTSNVFERDIQVQATVLPRLRMEMDFQRKAYGAGDEVEAKIELNTLANQPLSNYDFIAKASLDGAQFQEVKGQTDIGGRAMVKVVLPKELNTNDGLLNVLINYNGQTESISRSIPIVLNKIDLQFMPEGGDPIAGINGKIAFKALNEFGKPADVEGVVTDLNGNKITTFKSYHQGMGAFELMPAQGGKYIAYLTKPEGITELYDLPLVQERGYAISVDNFDKNELAVEINSTENEELNIVLISSGEIYFTQTLPAKAGAKLIKIPTKTLPIGTAQVTLFDSKEIPRAERLVFLNPHKKLNVEIKTNKEKYLPREKVEMEINITDERGMPMPGQFALSVCDDNLLTFADDKQGHILSYLLLESELNGDIEEPNFYFDAKEKHPEKDQLLALDYLMLTQGWRRFDWREVLWEQPVAMEYEVEQLYQAPVAIGTGKTVLQGKMVDAETGEPMIFGTVALYKNDVLVTGTETDFDGFYSIIELDAGKYDVVFSYTGYSDKKIIGAIVQPGRSNTLDVGISAGVTLAAVEVIYERPLVSKDETTQGRVFSAEEIKNLPTRNVNSLARLGAGASAKGDDKIAVRGSRDKATGFYIDGQRVPNKLGSSKKKKRRKDAVRRERTEPIIDDVAVEEEVAFEDASIDEAVEIEAPRAAAPPPPPPVEKAQPIAGEVAVMDNETGLWKDAKKRLPNDSAPPPPKNDDNAMFKVVEDQPYFLPAKCQHIVDRYERKKCSDEHMLRFIYGNLNYPEAAKEAGIEGMAVVKFVVEKDGRITNAQVVRDVGAGLGQEALKVVQKMDGLWAPGSQRGRPVRVQFNLPVKFSLDDPRINKIVAANLNRGFYVPRQFYSPKYAARQSASTPRNDFRKTVFWNSNITTDQSGKVTVEFYNSDAITTFRATVEGLGMDGSIGHGEQRFFTQMPFGMDVKIPTNLLTGDRLVLPLTLMNNSDQPISGNISINTPAHFTAEKPISGTINLKAKETKTLYPEYHVGFKARTGVLQVAFHSNGMQDAFQETVEVAPKGFPVHQVFGGNKPSETFEFEVNSPVEGSLEAAFTVHPSVLSELTSGLEKMIRQPGGCFEQTSSSNYPNVLVLSFLQKTGNAAPELVARAKQHLDFGYKRLKTFEIKTGGFDWFGKPPGHEALSAYGLMQFVDMKAVYPVEQNLIDRTAKWLLTRRDGKGGWLSDRAGLHSWQRNGAVADAYITWAMTEAGYGKKVGKEVAKVVKDANTTQDPYIMALAANILINLEDGRAGVQLAKLAELQKDDGSWTGLTHSMTNSRGKNLTVETTGLAALAFLKANDLQIAEDGQWSATKTINNAVDYLASAKTHYGFGSTQATVLALKALVKHAENMLSKMETGPVAVFVNGQKAGEQKINADQNEPVVFNGLAEHFVKGKNKVEVKFVGSQKALPYDLAVNYFTKQPQSNANCALELKTELVWQTADGGRRTGATVQMGETVRLSTTLTNKNTEGVANPIALVGIPAGLSVQPWQVKEMQEKNLFDFYEIKNGYVVFYFREMNGSEIKNIHLDLKADIPGEYEAPASSAYLYYENDVVVWDKPEVVGIGY